MLLYQQRRGFWSGLLLLRPLGFELQQGMILNVCQPYFGRCPSGEMAVCIHHPSDCLISTRGPAEDIGTSEMKTWSSSIGQRGSASMPISITPRVCGIEVRPSPLGSRGMFANQPLTSANLLLCEKPLALQTGFDAQAYGVGKHDILPGVFTNSRKLALLQQLVDKVAPNELLRMLRRKLFELHAGTTSSDSERYATVPDFFNGYTALSIINHNAHIVSPGNTSDHHDLSNQSAIAEKLTPTDQRPGARLEASMINHSCLPDASWSWLGDMFVVRADRDIAGDEEVTVAYVPSSYPAEMRKSTLQAGNGFECRCALGIADDTACRPDSAQEALTKSQHLQRLFSSQSNDQVVAEAAISAVRCALAHYPLDTYATLPCPQIAEPLFQLGQLLLTKFPKGKWQLAPFELKCKARDCFTACLEFGLGYKLIHYAPSAEDFYELLTFGHSTPRPLGVLALMASAERTHVTDRKRDTSCSALKTCAKKVYGIVHGEDKTFAKQHLCYTCKDIEVKNAEPRHQSNAWRDRKESRNEASSEGLKKWGWPTWLVQDGEVVC
ncbi:hypothetical protein DOTSEDRAFT_70855 [Dothistroma septosporum NZE10]|uniref:SET domain-containing protein n=1 Tax=Dothistroma septosporum (strain NZE10 / CBS 128990) TaxID=675120 RepID=N1PPS3_DOTSN|nr:hypothetical protein DOTSEDRAFT_70855 [Dothistroma septosporum NZE10]